MDSSSSWLGFSLSPQEHQIPDRSNPSFSLPGEGISSELSLVVGNMNKNRNSEPKLENFLGHSQNLPPITWNFDNSSNSLSGSDCSIGLSMIKSWLRTQPASGFAAKSQSLSLSMDADSRAGSKDGSGGDGQEASMETGTRRSIEPSGHRTSIYRGVTRHRWTGRYEAHLWDNSCRREGQSRKGKQGGYDNEEKAAIAYDLAALKYWGTMTTTNFPISNYRKQLEEMRHMTRQEYVASLRRKSSGFSRGASIYRGVTRHHQQGRWQARIGRVAGNKDLYLGTFSTQEEAAEAYDIAAIKFRGLNAVTNFDMNRYDVQTIMQNNVLPVGLANPRNHFNEDPAILPRRSDGHEIATSLLPTINSSNFISWSGIPFNPATVHAYSQLQDQDAARTLRDNQHYPAGDGVNRFLPLPMSTAVSFNGEGFLGEQGTDFPSSRPFSCRNILSISEQAPGNEPAGSGIPVCYGGPIFSVWNDS